MNIIIRNLTAFSIAVSSAACIDTDAVELSSDEAELSFYCPGVDLTAGVPTYRGLAGTYQRVGFVTAAEPYRLALATTVDDPDASGTFAGTEGTALGVLAPYAGTFRTLADNPAIGAVLSLDIGGDGAFDRTYFVLGLRRSLGGATVQSLCLQGGGTPFLMSRTLF